MGKIKVFDYAENCFGNFFNLLGIFIKRRIEWKFITRDINISNVSNKARIYSPCSIHNLTLGLGSYISSNSVISHTTIGKFCSLGPNLICGWGIHPVNGFSTSPIFYSTLKQASFTYSESNKIKERKKIKIGNDVFIGANATILDGVTIGDGAVIGAGAVVSKNIPPYAIAVGCPIRIIKYRFSDEIIAKLLEIRWWNLEEEKLKVVSTYFFDIEKFIEMVQEINSNKE